MFQVLQYSDVKNACETRKKCSATGNRTPVSRVTGGDTHHYTIVESISIHDIQLIQPFYWASRYLILKIFKILKQIDFIMKLIIIMFYAY